MKKILLVLLMLTFNTMAYANQPAQVMLIGTFHFANPGKDMVKVSDFDVLTEPSQSYLEEFTQRLAAFKPTHVLLEYNPENEAMINQRYRDYLEGKYETGADEIYQLGFRLARAAGLEGVQSFDHRELHWNAKPMFEYAEAHNSAEMESVKKLYQEITVADNQARTNMDLRGLLMRSNDPQRDRINMDSYLLTNSIGVRDGYSGADAAASWWQRNFRMYANLQQVAKPGTRIIAIAGSGHTAILKQLLAIDRRLVAVAVDAYF